MRNLSFTLLAGFGVLALAAVGKAEPMGPGIVPSTPVLPGMKWHVHDGTRPQPAAVKASGALKTKAPSDAVVLFDGEGVEAWIDEKGKDCPWTVEDGALVAKARSVVSRAEFGDCQIHIEWRIPAGRKVQGQGGGNSGIFLMGRYEVQILQSFNNPTYADGTAGSVYGQTPPLVNATLPQGEWQSYDIAFTAPKVDSAGKVTQPAKVTVFHNGVLVQNATEIMGSTVYRSLASYDENHPKKAPIKLQWHGDPVEFKNIWVRNLSGTSAEQ